MVKGVGTRIARPSDFILIAAAVAAAILLYFFLRPSQSAATAEISQDGVKTEAVSLTRNAVYSFDGNVVTVENGAVRISDANCPDKLCDAHNPISKGGEAIICLPNRFSVTTRSVDTPDVDTVVG